MLTAQVLTRNNSNTIRDCLDSLLAHDAEVIVGDLGSTDDTLRICDEMGAITHRLGEMERHEARNKLAVDGLNLAVEPWEIWAQGNLKEVKDSAYVSVYNHKTITKEIRLWRKPLQHINPTFERVDADCQTHSDVTLFCIGSRDYEYDKRMLAKWKQNPTLSSPYYYQACTELALKNYPEFFRTAEHYLFLDRSESVSAVMLRYYMAYAYLTIKGQVKPALQNLNLCLCARPLMAEFWCLTGDVYYHLLHDFRKALDFYENAMILGARRRSYDVWPIDLTKYREHPSKMIASCQKLMDRPSLYRSVNSV